MQSQIHMHHKLGRAAIALTARAHRSDFVKSGDIFCDASKTSPNLGFLCPLAETNPTGVYLPAVVAVAFREYSIAGPRLRTACVPVLHLNPTPRTYARPDDSCGLMARDVPRALFGALCTAYIVTALCVVPPFTDTARRQRATVDLREFCHEPDHNLTQAIRNTTFTAYARYPTAQMRVRTFSNAETCPKGAAEVLFTVVGDTRWSQANNTELWERLYARKLILSEKMLAEGRGNLGDTERLERFMHKLMAGDPGARACTLDRGLDERAEVSPAAGQPVTVAVVGGSVSAGIGVLQGNNSYVQRLYKWIDTTFPHKNHKLLNFALPATTSAYFAPCITSGLLPNTTNLVILEFTFNDSEMALFHHQLDDRTRYASTQYGTCSLHNMVAMTSLTCC